MSGIGGFRGVSASQDARFSNKQAKLMKSMKFPKELEKKVDLKKVNWPAMREWIAKRVTELLGLEDDVLINFLQIRLESEEVLSPKELYIELVPFLEKNAGLFMKELWTMLASACEKESGIPQQLLDEKAEEIKRKKGMQDQINEAIRKQREKDADVEDNADLKRENGVQRRPPDREERDRERGRDYERGKDRWGSGGGRGERDRDWRGGDRHQHRRWSQERSRDREREREKERPRFEGKRGGDRYGSRNDREHDRHRRGRDGGRDRRDGVQQEQRREGARPKADSPAEVGSHSKSASGVSSPSQSSASGERRPGRRALSASPEQRDVHAVPSMSSPRQRSRGPRSEIIKEPASPSASPIESQSPASASSGPGARLQRVARARNTSPSHEQGDVEARGRYQMSYDRGGPRGGRYDRAGIADREPPQERSWSPHRQRGRYRSPSPPPFDGGQAARRGQGPPRRGRDSYPRNDAGGVWEGRRDRVTGSPPAAGGNRYRVRSPNGRRRRLEEEPEGSPPRKRVYGGKLALSISPEPRATGEVPDSDDRMGSESSKEPKKKHHHKKKDKKDKREKKHRKHKKDKKAKKEKKKRKRSPTDSDSDVMEKGSEETRRRIEDQARYRALASMSARGI